MTIETSSEFRKNQNLEDLLSEITSILGPAEEGILKNFHMPKYPVVMIMGAGRCGSSLLLQWLAQTGQFAYPTNLLSRFYGAPYIGARIQQILTEQDHNAEIYDFREQMPFTSNLGKTKGALAPNEFWYFWRRFFPFGESNFLNEAELKNVDAEGFLSELAAIEAAFLKPIALKAMIANWNIPFISSILDKVLFIYIKREPFYNIQSKILARDKYFGHRRKEGWYSFKPKEYPLLKDLDPIEQVAGQVYYSNSAIEEGISSIDESRYLEITYEQLCSSPSNVFQNIRDKFRGQGVDLDWDYSGPEEFACANAIKLSRSECEAIASAYHKFSGIDITEDLLNT